MNAITEQADAFRTITEDLGIARVNDVDPQEVVDAVGAIIRMLDSRAGKLLRKGKPFVVVACDEVYYAGVYDLIRLHERQSGRWSDQDEQLFNEAMGNSSEEQQAFADQLFRGGGEKFTQ